MPALRNATPAAHRAEMPGCQAAGAGVAGCKTCYACFEQLAFCHGRWRCHDQILPSSILLELVQLLLDRRQSVRGLPCSLKELWQSVGEDLVRGRRFQHIMQTCTCFIFLSLRSFEDRVESSLPGPFRDF